MTTTTHHDEEKRMSVRNLATAGLGSFALGGPLLLLGVLTGGGVIVFVAFAGLWFGVLTVFVAVLQLGRAEHRMLRAQRTAIGALSERLDGGVASVGELPPALLERLGAMEANVAASLEADRRELLRIVDTRVLGIHETVRDLGTGERR